MHTFYLIFCLRLHRVAMFACSIMKLTKYIIMFYDVNLKKKFVKISC